MSSPVLSPVPLKTPDEKFDLSKCIICKKLRGKSKKDNLSNSVGAGNKIILSSEKRWTS